MKHGYSYLLVLLTLTFFIAQVDADIYVYTDQNGVRRFTDTKPSKKHTVYLRTLKPAQVRKRSKPGGISKTVANRFDALIKKAAGNYQVPFSLIKSVMHAESAFNPAAVSPKGAKGLMQIMPKNYKTLAITNPFDPEQSIMGGTQYLKTMLQKYNGIVELALAAYNAGPEAVDRYNRQIPPFAETRNYVKKVIQFYRTYSKMAG